MSLCPVGTPTVSSIFDHVQNFPQPLAMCCLQSFLSYHRHWPSLWSSPCNSVLNTDASHKRILIFTLDPYSHLMTFVFSELLVDPIFAKTKCSFSCPSRFCPARQYPQNSNLRTFKSLRRPHHSPNLALCHRPPSSSPSPYSQPGQKSSLTEHTSVALLLQSEKFTHLSFISHTELPS